MEGTISKLTDRGFGFISPADGSKDLFFHASDIEGVDFNDLTEGTPVTFELGESDRGPKADNIVIGGGSGAGDDSAASDDSAAGDDSAADEDETPADMA